MSRSQDERTLRALVGRRLLMRRIWLQLSQDDVAVKAGVTRNFVSAIERGAQGLDAFRLGQVAGALGVTVTWLLEGPDDQLTSPTPGTPSVDHVAEALDPPRPLTQSDAGSGLDTAEGHRTVMTTESASASQEWPVPGPHMT